eukprot:1934862-Prymnesium_polylepis.1
MNSKIASSWRQVAQLAYERLSACKADIVRAISPPSSSCSVKELKPRSIDREFPSLGGWRLAIVPQCRARPLRMPLHCTQHRLVDSSEGFADGPIIEQQLLVSLVQADASVRLYTDRYHHEYGCNAIEQVASAEAPLWEAAGPRHTYKAHLECSSNLLMRLPLSEGHRLHAPASSTNVVVESRTRHRPPVIVADQCARYGESRGK